MAIMNEYIKKMLDTAKVRRRREDLAEGVYVFTLLGLTHERREKREKLGKAFWVDVIVDECEGSSPTPVGSRMDFPLMLEGQFADMAFADLKTFFVELTKCADDEVSAKYGELTDTVSDEGNHSNPSQPARGMRICASTYTRKAKSGKNAGKDRTYPRWSHFEQTPSEIAARRKEVDALDVK